MKDVDLREPTSPWTMLIWVALNENVNLAKILWTITEMFESKNFCWSYNKASSLWETWCKHSLMVSWWRSSKEIRGKLLRTGEQNNSTTIQSRNNTMHWPPLIQGRRTGICRRINKSLITNGSQMLVFGAHWWTWYSMAYEQILQEQSQNEQKPLTDA